MTSIQIIDRRLEIEVLGWHKFWSFVSRLEYPLGHIANVQRLEEGQWLGGLRLPGTDLPGVIRAGSYYKSGEWLFWDVCKRSNALVIELVEEPYRALIVEVADPEATIAMIRAACRP